MWMILGYLYFSKKTSIDLFLVLGLEWVEVGGKTQHSLNLCLQKCMSGSRVCMDQQIPMLLCEMFRCFCIITQLCYWVPSLPRCDCSEPYCTVTKCITDFPPNGSETEILKVTVSWSCDRAKNFWLCTKSWDLDAQTKKLFILTSFTFFFFFMFHTH